MRKNFGAKPFLFPQPVMILASYNPDGTPNAMNAAWGGVIGPDEIVISLGKHRSTENMLSRKAFTVSFPPAQYAVEADYLGLVSGQNVPDKLARAGLHTEKAAMVDAPVIVEFPLTLECQLLKVSEDGLYHGKIVNVSMDERVLAGESGLDVEKFAPIVFDPVNNAYVRLGQTVGKAFSDGAKLK